MSRRVLQVYGPPDGGVPEHVLRLSEGLVARGWEVEVAAPAASAAAVALRRIGVTVHPLALRRAPHPRDVHAARRLRALDRERRYDVVHAHSSKAGAVVRAAIARPSRLVYTPHCFAFAAELGPLPGVQRRLYGLIEQALVPRTGTLIAASAWERREGERMLRGLDGRLHVVRNGAVLHRATEPHPALAAFKGEERLAGSVAVLRPQKDPLALVRAAAHLRSAGRLDFKVALVGNGPLTPVVEAEIGRLGLAERVRVFPFEAGSGRYLAALDLFVLPSLWESLPIGVLEALASATTVVATRVGGTPEAVEDGVGGRLVEPGDVAGLARVLDEVLHDPAQLTRLARAGHERFLRDFTLDRVADEVAALYEHAVRARG